jgi:hypothetical protein
MTARTSPSCGLVTAAKTKATLGVPVGKASVTLNGSVTVCRYTADVLTVRFQTGTTKSEFSSERAGFDQHGEKTVTVTGIGTEAFSNVLGTGQFAVSTIELLKGTNELLITGSASLTKIEALAKSLLSSI